MTNKNNINKMTNKNNINKIKNIEDLKKYQIICIERKDVKHCSKMLKKLGFEVRDNDSKYKVIQYHSYNLFETAMHLKEFLRICFFDEKLIKTLQKLIIEKKKVKDFEVAKDGRITKINNWESKKCLYFIGAWDYGTINFDDFKREGFEYYINLGLAYETEEARDRAMFKLEIETKLKNIAEKLNKKIHHISSNLFEINVPKYSLSIEYTRNLEKKLHCYSCGNNSIQKQGTIYCLNKNFLDIAKQEIGEENLIKYFGE